MAPPRTWLGVGAIPEVVAARAAPIHFPAMEKVRLRLVATTEIRGELL